MSNTVLTPVQLWQDYDAESLPLNTSFLRYEQIDGNIFIEAYINAFKTDEGIARAYVQGCMPADVKNPPCTILVDDTGINAVSEKNLRQMSSRGIFALTFDYYGKRAGKNNYSKYPADVEYANFESCGDRLYKALPSAYDTCMYHWVRMCHRVIAFAKSLTRSSKLVLTGVGTGSDIAWLTAAFNKNVTALIPVQSAGWHEMNGIARYAGEDTDFVLSDESESWVIGYAPQVYAKYITCPVMYVGTTNCEYTPIDRVETTLKVISAPVYRYYDAGRVNSFSPAALRAVLRFTEWQLKGETPFAKSPSLTAQTDTALTCSYKLNSSRRVISFNLIYAYDEVHSGLRHWHVSELTPSAKGTVSLPVYDCTRTVFCYLQAQYDDGETICSPMQAIKTDDTECERSCCRKTRILYDKRHSLSDWIVTGRGHIINDCEPKLLAGDMDILGLTADDGDLTTFAVGDSNMCKDAGTMLRFDVYCEKDRTVEVTLTAVRDKVTSVYRASAHIRAGEWQSCVLQCSDFKDEKLIPLKSWDDIKRFTLVDVAGALFNNILWT